MRRYSIGLMMLPLAAFAGDYTLYASIGAGLKFQEPDYVEIEGDRETVDFGSADSALIELGIRHDSLQFGLKHDSQWTTGWPLNDKPEYYKTEIFIRYTVDILTF